MPFLRIGSAEEDHEVGHRAVRDEVLGATDDIVRVLDHRQGLLVGSVCTSLGFGKSVGPYLLEGGCGPEVAFLLPVAAPLDQGVTYEGVVDGHHRTRGGARLVYLLHREDVADRVGADPPVFLGNVDGHETQFTHLPEGVHGVLFGLIDLRSARGHHLGGKVTRHVADHLLLFGQFEVHSLLQAVAGSPALGTDSRSTPP